MAKRARDLWGSFDKGISPVHEGSTLILSWSNHLSKAPPPDTLTLGIRFRHRNLEGT